MRGRRVGALAATTVLLAGLLVLTYRVFVTTVRGQLVDGLALQGGGRELWRLAPVVLGILDTVTITLVAIAVLGLTVVALARRQLALAAAAVATVGGSIGTTEALKHLVLGRPNLGVHFVIGNFQNSLPSGHATVVAAIAAAAVLVAPARLRGTVAVAGAAAAGVVGVSVVVGGWHRPSDALAALLVVGCWAFGSAAVVAALRQPPASWAAEPPTGRTARGVLGTFAVLGLAVGCGLLAALAAAGPAAASRGDLALAVVGTLAVVPGATAALAAGLLAAAPWLATSRSVPRVPAAEPGVTTDPRSYPVARPTAPVWRGTD